MGSQWHTHGGLKNCSSTTYIPLAISVMRKYLPALSIVDSLLSSHRSGRFNRKPAGGGPEGVADLREVVEKAASDEGEAVKGRVELVNLAVGRARTTNMVIGFVEAMVVVPWVAMVVLKVIFGDNKFEVMMVPDV